MKDSHPQISTPPSDDVRWQFTAWRVERLTLISVRPVERFLCEVTARTFFAARVLAFREFVLRAAIYPAPESERGLSRSKQCTPRADSSAPDFSSLHDDVGTVATSHNGSGGAALPHADVQGGLR